MSGVVCAVRGGLCSHPTIDVAAALATETELPLYLIYVVNVAFLSRTASSQVGLITPRMDQMGEFILLNAQLRAQAQGVEAQCLIRHGNIADEIIQACLELEAEYVVLGKPAGKGGQDVFTQYWLEQFRDQLERECDVQAVIVSGEESDEET